MNNLDPVLLRIYLEVWKMNIKDLEFGNVVKLRDGTLCLICPNIYYNLKKISEYLIRNSIDLIELRNIRSGGLEIDLSVYNDDFSAIADDEYSSNEDIIEVYEDYTLKNLLWKRGKR